jgi:hypothetical protein
MQAIRTRYHGPTNSRGSRIIAKCDGGSIAMPYNHALNLDANHATAAQMLLDRMNWSGIYYGGSFENDYYWVVPSAWVPVASIDTDQAEAA